MIEPGNFVLWQPPVGRPQWSKILERRNGHVTVAANGSTFEISMATDVLRCVRACGYCGKPVPLASRRYCNRTCANRARSVDGDDQVFAAIVEYKRQNDGASPPMPYLADATGISRGVIAMKILPSLIKVGRIRFVGYHKHRFIAVTGGKWTYDEP